MRARFFLGFFVSFMIGSANPVFSQPTHEQAYGDGRDGAIVITETITSQTRTAMIVSEGLEGESSLLIRYRPNQRPLEIGDEVFFRSMGESFSTRPNFDHVVDIQVEDSGTTFTPPIYRVTLDSPFPSAVSSNQAIYRIPHFTTVHITSTGRLNPNLDPGVYFNHFIFRASESITIDGALSANGAGNAGGLGGGVGGFAGGLGNPGNENNRGGGGAGTSAAIPSGGGGGANATPGQDGQSSNPETIPPGQGGEVYGDAALTELLDGAGGGSGQAINGQASFGGRGGGFIYLAAPVITINGSIQSKGEDGAVAFAYFPPERIAGGGGGAGGVIWLQAESFEGTGTLDTSGGKGGTPFFEGDNLIAGGGGDGGDGRVRIDTPYGYPIGNLDIISGSTYFGTYQAPASDNRSNYWELFE